MQQNSWKLLILPRHSIIVVNFATKFNRERKELFVKL